MGTAHCPFACWVHCATSPKVQWTKNKYLTLLFTANLPYNYELTKIRIPILKDFLPQLNNINSFCLKFLSKSNFNSTMKTRIKQIMDRQTDRVSYRAMCLVVTKNKEREYEENLK